MRKRRNNNKRVRFSILFPILTILGIGIIAALTSNYEKSWTFNWNGIESKIKDSISVYEYQSISSGIGGNGRAMPEEIESRKWIMENATEPELLKLTEFPNGNIKAIAYEGLLRKKNFENKTELISKAINDTIYSVYYQSGCLGNEFEIGEYLVQNVLMIDDRIPPFRPEIITDFGLSELEKQKILTEFHNRKK
ncbi:hypothetical protein SAMN05428642_1128 [Flaviramulus basaltis]|uniref:Uncharacterized protein n=1 Tax=Flaviramulus basaltis TaxID=369401 RepID=A0A1K2ISB1_9FLAO|nr:hypothetical protein [Flaviramulus basaltis]SFZ95198.1 hypothetical protein SAMN05428642_1128 [Flaviramulus basaltis]